MLRSPGQIEWTCHVLLYERATLTSAGLYPSVFLSFFEYRPCSSLLRAFVERWNYSTNTAFLGDREMTPTLSEIRQLAGFPISGLPYDEFIPRDSDMTSLPFPLREVFGVYERLRDARGRVSWALG